jgi:hypothetical protein
MGDADITLRHLTRRHAEALARHYIPAGPFEILGWADTQVTCVERRLVKTLLLRLSWRRHALQIEFVYRYDPDLPERVHDYRGLTRMAFRAERPGVWRVEARTAVGRLNAELDLGLPESDDYETVAGLLIEKFRRIPDKGESLAIGPLIIEIVAATDRAIEAVRITRRKK